VRAGSSTPPSHADANVHDLKTRFTERSECPSIGILVRHPLSFGRPCQNRGVSTPPAKIEGARPAFPKSPLSGGLSKIAGFRGPFQKSRVPATKVESGGSEFPKHGIPELLAETQNSQTVFQNSIFPNRRQNLEFPKALPKLRIAETGPPFQNIEVRPPVSRIATLARPFQNCHFANPVPEFPRNHPSKCLVGHLEPTGFPICSQFRTFATGSVQHPAGPLDAGNPVPPLDPLERGFSTGGPPRVQVVGPRRVQRIVLPTTATEDLADTATTEQAPATEPPEATAQPTAGEGTTEAAAGRATPAGAPPPEAADSAQKSGGTD